jgi:Protein of unknown function (DUF3433)
LTVALLLTTILLVSYSSKHHGLGEDDGSKGLLFGWRFTPTLIAVLYVQLTAMLLDEIKRTESFARMARAATGGVEASTSILQALEAWWNAFGDGLSKAKNGGKRSYLLLCCASVNIVGFLFISPLSSSLLSSQDLVVSKKAQFTRIEPNHKAVLPLTVERDTYFRTMGHLLQNVSTSAWITDKYTILPFWPSDLTDNMPLGPILPATASKWEVDTVVMNTNMECEFITLRGSAYVDNGTSLSIELASDSGCNYGLDINLASRIVSRGGASWTSDASMFLTSPTAQMSGDLIMDAQNGYMSVNHSQGCGSREILLFTTSWSDTTYPFSFRPDFQEVGYVCSSKNYMAQMLVTASLSDSSTTITFDEQEYEKRRTLIPNSIFDPDQLQKLTLDQNWANLMSLTYQDSPPIFGGLSVLLGALYKFNITALIANSSAIVNQAIRIKQRFLGEVLQHSLTQQIASQTDELSGQVTVVETRVVVTRAVAIILVVLFFISLCLMLPIWFLSGLHHRPLNLCHDPATAMGVASLIAYEPGAWLALQSLDQASKKDVEESLRGQCYYTTPNAIHELDPGSTESKHEQSQNIVSCC